MATTTRRVRRKRTAASLTSVRPSGVLLNRSTRERSSVHENTLKAQLMAVLAKVGEPDGDEGEHRKLLLETPIEFTTYKGEKGARRRSSASSASTARAAWR